MTIATKRSRLSAAGRNPPTAAARWLVARGLVASLALVACLAPFVARAEGRYALLVGVEKYDPSELAPLDFAEDDVEAMGRALEKLGFSVVTMTSAAPIAARRPVLADDILAQVDRRLADREKTDTVVLAFSGHGVQLKGERADAGGVKELWFCPERARPGDPRTMLAISEVLRRLERCAAGRKLLLVDACRNDFEPPNGSKSGRVIELPAAGVKRPPIPAGLVAMFSCRPGEQSFELKDLRHSIFSHHVIEFLEGRAPADRYPRNEVGITELTSYVRTKTRDTADVRLDRFQVPDVVLPDGSFGEWPLGRLGKGPAASGRDLASVDRKPAMERPVPSAPPVPKPQPSPAPGAGPGPGEVIANSLGMKLVGIRAGEFEMGSNESDDEKPVHRVGITKPFWLGQTEVTQGQWERVMGTTPWRGKSFVKDGPTVAASYVTWDDAVEFCGKLTEIERRAGRLPAGGAYRLPTEAEWEYACRAGTKTKFSFGDDEARLSDHAWWGGLFGDGNAKTEQYAHEVGKKKANPWGLFDMHGNVYEWCSDWYDEKYYAQSPAVDPKGPSSAGSFRVIRGGSWSYYPVDCRSASRGGPPSYRYLRVGFRVVLSVE